MGGRWSGGSGLRKQGEEARCVGADAHESGATIEGLEAALGFPGLLLVDVDWSLFARSFASMRSRPLLDGVAEAHRAMNEKVVDEGLSTQRDELLALPNDEREAAILALVIQEVAAVLGLADAHAIDADEPLNNLGLDSLMAVQLRDRFEHLTQTELSATLAFDYPTRLLSAYFAGLLAPAMVEPGAMDWEELMRIFQPSHLRSSRNTILRPAWKNYWKRSPLRHRWRR